MDWMARGRVTADNYEGINGSAHFRTSPGTRLDEILAITEVFADILASFFSSGHSYLAPPEAPCNSPVFTNPTTSSIRDCSGPEMATCLVVLACYFLPLNIYIALLIHTREYTATTAHPQAAFRSTHHPLPIVSISSFNLLDLPELNVSVNLQLISVMFRRVQSMAILYFRWTSSPHDDTDLRDPHTPDEESSRLASPVSSLAEIAIKQIQKKERHVSATLQSISEDLHLRKCLGANSGIHWRMFP